MHNSDRRRWLLYAAGAAAAAGAGVAVGIWRTTPAPLTVGAGTGLLAYLQSDDLRTPSQTPFKWKATGKKPLLVNFWATWCPPCIEEMPDLERIYQQNCASSVVGIAIDNAASVQTFLRTTPVSYPIILAGLESSALMRSLGNTSGALPFTVLVSPQGEVGFRKLGKTSFEELSALICK
jgi:thiol-disulfide isomerase/thioredoxin